MQPGTLDTVTANLKEAADGFKKLQLAILAFTGVCTVLLIVITIKLLK